MSDASTSLKSTTSRERIALVVPDISALAKSLRTMLSAASETPSQVQMLNWLAKGAGYQNYQSLRATKNAIALSAANAVAVDVPRKAARSVAAVAELSPHATKALTQFDEYGKLSRWPHKFTVQRIAMRALWLRFDAKRRYTEKEVNSVFKAWHTYGDHVTLRRELINMKLLARESDGSQYWKIAQQPNDEIKAFLRAFRAAYAGEKTAL